MPILMHSQEKLNGFEDCTNYKVNQDSHSFVMLDEEKQYKTIRNFDLNAPIHYEYDLVVNKFPEEEGEKSFQEREFYMLFKMLSRYEYYHQINRLIDMRLFISHKKVCFIFIKKRLLQQQLIFFNLSKYFLVFNFRILIYIYYISLVFLLISSTILCIFNLIEYRIGITNSQLLQY